MKDEFIFSSSVKAITGLPSIQLTDSAAGWCGFMLHGSVPEPFTIHDQIRSLPAGHYLMIGKYSNLSTAAYYSIFDDYSTIQNADDTQVNFELMAQNLAQSVTDHLVADVPVGLFLSSGIDSNVIAYHAKDHPKLVAFTLDFEEFGEQQNESKLAISSAKNLGIKHQVLKFDVDHTESFLEEFFLAMDQPSIDGLNVWMISKAVSEQGFKAVLSGLGGDELFAGYPSFKDVPRFETILSLTNKLKLSSRSLEKVSSILPGLSHPKISGFGCSSNNSIL